MSAKRAVATTARARLPSSRAMPTCSRMRRPRPTERAGPFAGRVVEICMPLQFLHGPEDGDAVAGVQRVVTSRAQLHRRVAHRHDRHGGQVAEVGPEGVVRLGSRLHDELDDGEVDARQLNGVGGAEQAGLDEGGGRQRRHVEHAARSRHPFQRPCHRGVGQLDHQRQVRPDLPDPERRLERVDLVHLDADHGDGPVQARFVEALAPVGVTADVGHAPVVEGAPAAGIGIVVDHDHRGAAEPRTARRHAARRPADRTRSRVRACRRGRRRPSGMVPGLFGPGGCRSVKCRCLRPRGLEPPWGCSSVVRAGDS